MRAAAPASRSLYDPRFEHDACGVGFVARADGTAGHPLVDMALTALERLAHRGAMDADGASGDGAGVLTQIPRKLFLAESRRLHWSLEPDDRFAVGMLFLPPGDNSAQHALAESLQACGLRVAGWRPVPIDPGALGASARAALPEIRQVVIVAPRQLDDARFEARLYRARKGFERVAPDAYVCSLSSRTIVYKALCAGAQLRRFYLDLADPTYESALAVFHQRYSTNTWPTWSLAQPLRLLAHNGEINTLWANRAWMRAREFELPKELRPAFREGASDSATLDEALELLARGGRELDHALAMLIVPAWESAPNVSRALAAFYRYHASVMEPWDGPAALAFSDGRVVGAALDRNGLRPCRFKIAKDGLVVAGSEVGLFDLDDLNVLEKGRLGPGQTLLVDVVEGKIIRDGETKQQLAARRPYGRWLGARPLDTEPTAAPPEPAPDGPALMALQRRFGLTAEDVKYVLQPAAGEGREPTWSMGDDTPIPPLGRSPRSIYTFLRQRFAQVTNPPIDPLREAEMMSLRGCLGPRPPLLADGPQRPLFELETPFLSLAQLAAVRHQTTVPVAVLDCTYEPVAGALRAALDALCEEAERAVQRGAGVLLLDDRGIGDRAPIPAALSVGAVHHQLLRSGLRTRAGLLVAAGDCWDVHHAAVLLGYGAGAVCPWLALATARTLDAESGESRLLDLLALGLRKVMSKMGISTVSSYRGGQLFEVLGLGDDVVERCFAGTPSRIGGLGWEQVERRLLDRRARAVAALDEVKLPDHGQLRYRRGEEAEHHAWHPIAVRALHRAVGSGRSGGTPEPAAWTEMRDAAAGDSPGSVRALLDFVAAGPTLPLDAVEPAESLVRRFVISAMSLGALSPEAHQTLTLAMNRLGARSNTGEGGEDPELYAPIDGGGRRDSKIKQIASGRFGVTAAYLARAEEIEIKIAQGSKPGEGGQLPGHKVTELIARLRHAQPGRPLISPPPHHDIYSIEDLAQLIFDLKRCNPRAAVGVKLVAEAGVGTVAAGVAKAGADYVSVAGHDGGTGASPLSSIKHAGCPWELGLAETQQVLLRNGLRDRVRVRVEGGLITGTDVLVAALLGADEYGFGTAPLVAFGCDMARQCHLNTCPTGIATQRPELRAKFRGTPEQVVRYFLLLADELRALLATLGLRTISDAIGRVDLLRQVRFDAGLDLDAVLAQPPADAWAGVRAGAPRPASPDRSLDDALVDDALHRVRAGRTFNATLPIRNADRAVGARISGALALLAPQRVLAPATVHLSFDGSAGQSFGAFCGAGMRLELTGEANDYVAKGLCGAELVLRPSGRARYAPDRNVILGNVALYGATAGQLFAAGVAGERFAVRNAGAVAVVEGVGDHGCEYMTGGTVVVLGETGRNFGAGMTGGIAFVYDRTGALQRRTNLDSVRCVRPDDEDADRLRALIRAHVEYTGSASARALLSRWNRTLPRFWRVEPRAVTAPVASVPDSIAVP